MITNFRSAAVGAAILTILGHDFQFRWGRLEPGGLGFQLQALNSRLYSATIHSPVTKTRVSDSFYSFLLTANQTSRISASNRPTATRRTCVLDPSPTRIARIFLPEIGDSKLASALWIVLFDTTEIQSLHTKHGIAMELSFFKAVFLFRDCNKTFNI